MASRMILSNTRWRDSSKAVADFTAVALLVIALIGAWSPIVFPSLYKAAKPTAAKSDTQFVSESPKQVTPETTRPVAKTELAQATSEPVREVEKEPEPVMNQQAEKMAREFEFMISAVTGKALQDYETKWYSEYLAATMPAKFKAICGQDECDQYEHLLDGLKSKSNNIQLHFRGLEPFVTRKRYLQSKTPLSGPVIDLAADATKPAAVQKALSELNEKSSPVAQAAHEEPKRASEPPNPLNPDGIASADGASSKQREDIVPIDEPMVEFPAGVFPGAQPTRVAATHSQLDLFSNRQAFVTCRKCGQEHRMTYGYFAQHNQHICAKCGVTMNTVAFSAKLAKDMNRIVEDMSR